VQSRLSRGSTRPTNQFSCSLFLLSPASWYTNPQTLALTDLLKIKNQINPIPEGYLAAMEEQKRRFEAEQKQALAAAKAAALAELDVDPDMADAVDEEPKGEHPAQVEAKEALAAASMVEVGENPEEIAIEDDEDE
jgi:hypothetical protein